MAQNSIDSNDDEYRQFLREDSSKGNLLRRRNTLSHVVNTVRRKKTENYAATMVRSRTKSPTVGED